MAGNSLLLPFEQRGFLYHRKFSRTWQTFDRTLCSQCFSFAVESPRCYERDRSMGSSVMPSLSSIVESNASLDIDSVPSIERPVSAADHVDVVCLWMRYLFQTLRPLS